MASKNLAEESPYGPHKNIVINVKKPLKSLNEAHCITQLSWGEVYLKIQLKQMRYWLHLPSWLG